MQGLGYSKAGWPEGPVRASDAAMSTIHEGAVQKQPALHDRVLMDNVTLAFAALFHAMVRRKTERAEEAIVGTPFDMIAYWVQCPDDLETLHFEIRPRSLRG